MIVISEFMDAAAVEFLRGRFDVAYDSSLIDRRDELLTLLSDPSRPVAALIVRNRTRVDAELLAAAPALRVVGRLGVGLDNIDVAACKARAIAVIPATGANASAVAEYVIATTLVLRRGAFLSSAAMVSGAWPRMALSDGSECKGATLGLVGFGDIGRRTASLAQAIGMRVIGYDLFVPADATAWREAGVEERELDALLADADAVSLHVPLNDDTRGLMNATRIARMKAGAVLINTARGGIVDEAALAAALRDGRLAGAALDVFEHEPWGGNAMFAGLPNLILTPHIAGVTHESNVRVSSMIAEKIAQFLNAPTPIPAFPQGGRSNVPSPLRGEG